MTHKQIIELSPLGLLKISGEQAQKFLQGQLTCNLDEVTPTTSRLGAHCNPQGRIISLFRIFMVHSDYYLQMPRELIAVASKALQKYAVFFKVKLTDASDELLQLGYLGTTLSELPEQIDAQIIKYNVTIICISNTPTRYLGIGTQHDVTALQNKLMNSAITTDYPAWKSVDLQQKIPAIYPETSELFLPHDIDLPALNAVSFNKGCYTGQEIIARMQYRGKLKNHLHEAMIDRGCTLHRGQDIFLADKQRCGTLVDYVQLHNGKQQLLVIATDDAITQTLYADNHNHYPLEFLY